MYRGTDTNISALEAENRRLAAELRGSEITVRLLLSFFIGALGVGACCLSLAISSDNDATAAIQSLRACHEETAPIDVPPIRQRAGKTVAFTNTGTVAYQPGVDVEYLQLRDQRDELVAALAQCRAEVVQAKAVGK